MYELLYFSTENTILSAEKCNTLHTNGVCISVDTLYAQWAANGRLGAYKYKANDNNTLFYLIIAC